MDEQRQPREPVLALLLEQLEVLRAAAEALRQNLLEHPQHLAADQRDTLAGELAEAPDPPQVATVSELLQRASAVTLLDDAVVVALHVEQHLRRPSPAAT